MKVNLIGPNQTELSLGGGNILVLFSYSTPVSALVDGKAYRTEKKWSATTSKHINRWLDGRDAEEKPQAFFNALEKGA